ncbi:ATP:cob(I)alamin adenosyltransferase [Thecamonas trahens ATCC 50062]|uniref:Corrinoid adenosyltransferase MMAB n=1 Tax=Thecamonas trahens ATCC 50062 TaxID=461836 RepID=A0A0L0DRG0_THETB|nr:ATP:cob(I)alamin adenosyltransferase [Thecamonas trahens ATCC 50062]KNC54875.1 ATP:cob(I)alamin adenosyltransferase [Thecamonas trahens ATCC 50062]|eukprot:XP_013753471.1 ATP:cob(I)alamin adenosyltransferase [Thecamonas trahens ATCC 50062]
MASSGRSKSNLYTRTGDDGTSSLYTGERRAKDDAVFEALGSLDEVSSHLGVARVALRGAEAADGGDDVLVAIDAFLEGVQSRLVELGSHVATPLPPPSGASDGSESDDEDDPVATRRAATAFPATHVAAMETFIDEIDGALPPLTMFILPGGTPASAHIHVARAVARRAERTVARLRGPGGVSDDAFAYINRLSDALFAVARAICHAEGGTETVYSKGDPQ